MPERTFIAAGRWAVRSEIRQMNLFTTSASVAVGIVTYADRWNLLEKVLERVVSDSCVGAIWVVDNGSSYSTTSTIDARGWSARVKVIRNEDNLGSAAGYAQVLTILVSETNESLFYLLDDDNRPEPNAISAALEAWVQLGGQPDNCCLSLRNDRPEQSASLKNGKALRHKKNTFIGFHFVDAIKRSFKRQTYGQNGVRSMVDVDYSPYGGLLLHRSWIARVGLPNVAYYLYADDHEFTTRITSHGGRIMLLADSRIEDLETSWHLKPTATRAGMFSASSPNLRLYYSIRNRVDFERRFLVESVSVYALNVFANLLVRFVRAAFAERTLVESSRKLAIAVRAISDGWNGRLGRVQDV